MKSAVDRVRGVLQDDNSKRNIGVAYHVAADIEEHHHWRTMQQCQKRHGRGFSAEDTAIATRSSTARCFTSIRCAAAY
jgi:hypothetical protein